MIVPAEIHSVPNRRPDLSQLPPEIASRVEDMWRVGSILSGYFYVKVERDELRKGLGEMSMTLGQRISDEIVDRNAAMDDASNIRQKYYMSAILDRYKDEALNAPFNVNTWVTTTHSECNRLASEASLIFFQMALDRLPSKNEIFATCPLLDCLRRLRNASVHHKSLSLLSDEFVGELVNDSDPPGTGIKVNETEAWYLKIDTKDLDKSRPGPVATEIAEWFMRQAARWPLEKLLILGVVELCAAYRNFRKA